MSDRKPEDSGCSERLLKRAVREANVRNLSLPRPMPPEQCDSFQPLPGLTASVGDGSIPVSKSGSLLASAKGQVVKSFLTD